MRLTDEGGYGGAELSQVPLIRPSVRTGAPVPIPSVPSGHLPLTRGVGPLWGEGFWAAQIGGDWSFCGTFGYIYWELGRSAPVGGWRPGCTVPRREGVGVCPLIRPSGPPSPRGEGFWGEPPHSPLKGKAFGRLIAAPTERNPLWRAGEGTRPYGAITNGSIYKKRDRSGTCPLKHRGETQFRRTFFCLLFFQEK